MVSATLGPPIVHSVLTIEASDPANGNSLGTMRAWADHYNVIAPDGIGPRELLFLAMRTLSAAIQDMDAYDQSCVEEAEAILGGMEEL